MTVFDSDLLPEVLPAQAINRQIVYVETLSDRLDRRVFGEREKDLVDDGLRNRRQAALGPTAFALPTRNVPTTREVADRFGGPAPAIRPIESDRDVAIRVPFVKQLSEKEVRFLPSFEALAPQRFLLLMLLKLSALLAVKVWPKQKAKLACAALREALRIFRLARVIRGRTNRFAECFER